jgi:transcription elongation GreA/GreB family factor
VKEKVVAECRRVIQERIANLKSQMAELVNDAANDSKSTAGDKHETSRAMMQLEQEKLGGQLKILEEQQRQLDQLPLQKNKGKVSSGSLVETDRGWIFIGAALGKISVNQKDVICISQQSPLGKLLFAQDAGSNISLNNIKYQILSIQ